MEELIFGVQDNTTMTPAPEFAEEATITIIRAQIASHPLYPKLLQSYADCRKVGAPPEVAKILDEIREEIGDVPASFGVVDPELDHFMESYCHVLIKLKSVLCKPFDEATEFLDSMTTELSRLCTTSDVGSVSMDEGAEELVDEEMENCSLESIGELKEKVLQKYSGYIPHLKHEFSKNKKNGKLPSESRQILLNWWNLHYAWPYPTESDKSALAGATGLDPKQINNWFINQRKRHWKPPQQDNNTPL